MVDEYYILAGSKFTSTPFWCVLLYCRDSLEVRIPDVMDILPIKCFWDLPQLLVHD